MSVSSYVLVAILLGFVVSWVPRVAPFILVKYRGLPKVEIGHLPQVKDLEVLASLPTFYVALKSKNLLYAVITGIVSMAILRLIF